MAGRSLFAALLAVVVLLFSCCAAYAQEQQPTQPVEGESTPEPGGIYLYLEDELVMVPRDITGGNQMVEFGMLELLKGPTEEEKAAGYVTYIPEGVKLQYTTVKQDRSEFSINLSRELMELEGDTESAEKALTQIVRTAQDISGIANIGVTVAGEAMGDPPEDAFEALGVAKSETGTEGSQAEGSQGGIKGWLVLVIILGALAIILAAVVVVYLLKRRKSGKHESRSAKASGKQSGKKKP